MKHHYFNNNMKRIWNPRIILQHTFYINKICLFFSNKYYKNITSNYNRFVQSGFGISFSSQNEQTIVYSISVSSSNTYKAAIFKWILSTILYFTSLTASNFARPNFLKNCVNIQLDDPKKVNSTGDWKLSTTIHSDHIQMAQRSSKISRLTESDVHEMKMRMAKPSWRVKGQSLW